MTAVRPEDVLVELPDKTVKQRNPFTGTQVWTVPGRANRPLGGAGTVARELEPGEDRRFCAFCSERYLDTPPERARLVDGGEGLVQLDTLAAGQLFDSLAQFRRIPNLFEILPLDYWRLDHGFEPSRAQQDRAHAYLADPAGREHLLALVRTRAKAAGAEPELGDESVLRVAMGWFASGHEVVVPRRHFVDGATRTDQLASSGTLSVDEHRAYIGLTVNAMAQLYAENSHALYVAVFQNWLKPAGASFDHLHKQVVAIDEHGSQVEALAARVAEDQDACNALGLDIAVDRGLLLAENDHAVAWAGFGHRYPTIEVWSLAGPRPWQQTEEQLAGMADLLHAVHAGTGPEIPCNEEWHYRPPGVSELVPWRVMVKWRISTLAGFEGATRIYLNTLSPWALRERLLPRLFELRSKGLLGDLRLGEECRTSRGALPTGAAAAG